MHIQGNESPWEPDGIGSIARLRLVATLALAGCAGGGGSIHQPPESIAAGTTTPLRLELTAWGAGWGRLSHRYRQLECRYRTARDSTTHRLNMTPVSEDRQRFVTQCLLPPLARHDSMVTYWFAFAFDGQPNRRPGGTVPIR
jgi:hypothetical protein